MRHAILGALRAHGVVVVRLGDAAHDGVEAVTEPLPDDLLDDDGHLLVVGFVGSAREVLPRVAPERRGVDRLDPSKHLREPPLGVGVVVGQHVGRVDARERLKP